MVLRDNDRETSDLRQNIMAIPLESSFQNAARTAVWFAGYVSSDSREGASGELAHELIRTSATRECCAWHAPSMQVIS